MEHIRVATVQLSARAGDFASNSEAMENYLQRAADEGAQLVCFPEASLTGYDVARAGIIALDAASAQVNELFAAADELDVALCAGFFESAGDKLFITQALHTHDATLWCRKTHLGSKEQTVFAAGDRVETLDVAGVRVGVQICWETHFPELTALLRSQGAELVLMPFASGTNIETRRTSWMKYLPARAYDNGLYVIACNALFTADSANEGTDEDVRGGGLLTIDPYGEAMDGYFELDEHMLVCDISGVLPREQLDAGMGSQSYFDCRKPELYGSIARSLR